MSADTIVLKAKLLAPPTPEGFVLRARLRKLLEPARPLTLLSAPAGFGKTVAVSQWLDAMLAPSAWLSLDEGDNDAARFFVHLVAALQNVASDCGRAFIKAAGSLRDVDVPVLVASLANQLHEIEEPFFLVLDDYHVISSSLVHQTVGFMVEHMPPTMHLVLTSRREPPLPLSRWRMRQRVCEVTQKDLRFAGDEVAAFLNGTMGLQLEDAQALLLEERTEGWVGGLQLAALSLVERENRNEFLTAFAGDDRYIMDYLTAEVLAGQPPEIRRFLLRTSILERMNASLCEGVSGQSDCAEILERLERERLFVVALDNKREWYRYHHLFQGLLQHQLAASDVERARDCHTAASRWYQGSGSISEAVRHALLASNTERVGELIEAHGWEMALSARSKQVLRWMGEIPQAVLWESPRRLHLAIWCEYIRTGTIREPWRERLEEMAKSDSEASELAEELILLDAYEAARDPARYEEAIVLASRVLGRETCDFFPQINAQSIVTCCLHALGDVKAASPRYDEVVANGLTGQFVSLFFFTSLGQGRLRALTAGPAAGRKSLEATLAIASERGWDSLPVSSSLLLGLGEQLYELGELEACEEIYERALILAEHEPSTARHLIRIGLARLYSMQGRVDECDAQLQTVDAESYIRPLLPMLADLGIERARLDLARGRLDDVQAFLETRGFGRHAGNDAMNEVHGLQDAGKLLVGRYLLLRHQHPRAIVVLTETLQAAVSASRIDTVIRSRVDLAVARFLNGERQQAFQQLDAAIDCALGLDIGGGQLSQPRGYHQIFVDAPADFQVLLARRLEEGVEGAAQRAWLEQHLADRRTIGPPGSGQAVKEPLSPSERKVLEQLVAGLSNREIGECLFVSPNTVKTHVRRIYAKLGAKNRAEAIRAANILGILQA